MPKHAAPGHARLRELAVNHKDYDHDNEHLRVMDEVIQDSTAESLKTAITSRLPI